MPSPEALIAWLAAPALVTVALVLSGFWQLSDSPLPPSLRRELERRRQDLSRLEAATGVGAQAGPFTRGRAPPDLLGCAALKDLTGVSLVGSGITKRVLRATLPSSGEAIALKSVYWTGHDVSRCMQRHGHPGGCYRLAAYKLLQEAVLMQSLDHPGIVKACSRYWPRAKEGWRASNANRFDDSAECFINNPGLQGQCYGSSSTSEMKVVTMLELGTPLVMIHLLQTPWEERFKICLDLAELLYYLANSPLGSLALLDFQTRQFVMVNGSLKVTDLDDVSTNELSCQTDNDCTLEFPTKRFFLRCARHGKCEGRNEKKNLFNAYRYFFTYLLPHTAPFALQPVLKDILNATGDLRYGANETLRAFQKVLHLYKSGLYLQKKKLLI
ncbi:hypothetical protein JRQ81_001123 [Phrynocephalus forsythii]|uniref:FAM69 protein-kinase domain-containing protein n=1 Tax=Phrynocephalus forsythii TaxID=171643 RepID=A0A9Q0Y7E5_9SAUR|nr:hypothetical protein JRQ81_001123 [Phrynocephalus forsythii]